MHKPNDYTSVEPYLIVEGASATIDFLKTVFGAQEIRRFPGADGKLQHAEVRIDDTVVMLADGGNGWQSVPSHVHVYVKDVAGAAVGLHHVMISAPQPNGAEALPRKYNTASELEFEVKPGSNDAPFKLTSK